MNACFPANLAAIGDIGSGRVWAIVLGTLLAIVAISLLIASWTKWGQTKSLTKCIALAFLAHVWLLMYAYGTRIVTPGFGGGNEGGMRTANLTMEVPMVMLVHPQQPDESTKSEDPIDAKEENQESHLAPWEAPLKRLESSPSKPNDIMANQTPKIPELLVSLTLSMPVLKNASPVPELPLIDSVEQIAQLAIPTNQLASTPFQPSVATLPADISRAPVQPTAPQKRRMDQQPVPINYQMRMSSQRLQFASQNGRAAVRRREIVRVWAGEGV